jgi:two-component system, LytTR family, sensor kinase
MPIAFSSSATNLIGHALGTLLFALFLWLAIRRTPSLAGRAILPIAAAALAFLWDFSSIFVLTISPAQANLARLVATLAFAAISLLPAVLLDVCASANSRIVVQSGYGLSVAAIALHLTDLATGREDLHRLGLAVITLGFVILTLLSVARTYTSQSRTRLLAAMALLLFSASFVHFTDGHMDQAWSAELLVHHAGIPVALFILLQDYRFVFADAFIQLVANALLAILFGWVATSAASAQGPMVAIAITALAIGTFTYVRTAIERALTHLLFARPSAASVEAAIDSIRTATGSEDNVVATAAHEMAALMHTSVVDDATGELTPPGGALIAVRIPGAMPRKIALASRQNGRTFMSLDLAVLEQLAETAAERIRQMRESESDRLMAQAELKALQAQIHPHFLFNSLNAVYGIIPRAAHSARQAVLDLSEIFRYLLDTRNALVPIEDELRVIRAYLGIEAHRLGSRLRTEIDVAPGLSTVLIPSLTVQPLVENAVKHGIAPNPEGGVIKVRVSQDDTHVRISVEDTGRGFAPTTATSGTRIGLENVARRLQLHYGDSITLDIVSDAASGTVVSFRIPHPIAAASVDRPGLAVERR